MNPEAPHTSPWRSTNVQGLYQRMPSGIFYSRYSINGNPTFRSLGTAVFEHAKIRHAQRQVEVEKDRQRGADLTSDFKTLGACLDELVRRWDA